MVKDDIKIQAENGLHLRPISLIVQKAKEFSDCNITVEVDGEEADAKSAFSLQELDLDFDKVLTLKCDGGSEKEAFGELKKIILEAE